MKFENTRRFLTVMLLALTFVFSATTASASKQALIKLQFESQFFGGTTFYARTVSGTVDNTTIVATVNTSTAPTPKVLWASNLLVTTTSFTASAPYTPYYAGLFAYQNLAASLSKSHAGAAPSGGSTVPHPTATTKCFASIAPAAPGTPNLPGSCFPRLGTAQRSPGAKRFGGTARMLVDVNAVAVILATSPSGLSYISARAVYTPALTGPQFVGNYGIFRTGTRTNTVLGTAKKTMVHLTTAPHTTGQVTVMGSAFYTDLSFTGSHTFNTANLTGMISLARPRINNTFTRNSAGIFSGRTTSFNAIDFATVTFAGEVPEPGAALLLGLGALGLAGLGVRRRR